MSKTSGLSSNSTTDSNATTTNLTSVPTKFSGRQFDVDYHSTILAVAFLIIVTNGLVLIIFRFGRLSHRSSNYLLLSLTISDISTGLLAIPMHIYCECTYIFKVCLLSFEINRFIGISTVCHIALLTVEKYVFAMYPLRHRDFLKRRNMMVTIATVWSVSLLVSLIPLAWLLDLQDVRNRFSESDKRKQTIHESFVFIVFYALPLIIMLVCYTRMLSVIVSHKLASRKNSTSASTSVNACRYSRFKPMILVLALVTIFLSSWGWWYFGTIKRANWDKIPVISPLARSILTMVRYSSSFLNPLLYTLIRRDFRMEFWRLVQRHGSSSPSPDAQIDMENRPEESVKDGEDCNGNYVVEIKERGMKMSNRNKVSPASMGE